MSKFKCPKCNTIGECRNDDSRTTPDGTTRRRKKCLSCSAKFTTYETLPGSSEIEQIDYKQLASEIINEVICKLQGGAR